MDIARKLAAEALSLAAEWEANPTGTGLLR
jgi:hypothetical protein